MRRLPLDPFRVRHLRRKFPSRRSRCGCGRSVRAYRFGCPSRAGRVCFSKGTSGASSLSTKPLSPPRRRVGSGRVFARRNILRPLRVCRPLRLRTPPSLSAARNCPFLARRVSPCFAFRFLRRTGRYNRSRCGCVCRRRARCSEPNCGAWESGTGAVRAVSSRG